MSLNCLKTDYSKGKINKDNFILLAQLLTNQNDASNLLIISPNTSELENCTAAINKMLLCTNYLCQCENCLICGKLNESEEFGQIQSFDYSLASRKFYNEAPITILRNLLSNLNKYGGHGNLYIQYLSNIDAASRRDYVDLLLPFLENPKANIRYILTAKNRGRIPGVISSRCKTVTLNSNLSLGASLEENRVIITRKDNSFVYENRLLKDIADFFFLLITEKFSYKIANYIDQSIGQMYSNLNDLSINIEQYKLNDIMLLFYLFCRELYFAMIQYSEAGKLTLLYQNIKKADISIFNFNKVNNFIKDYDKLSYQVESFSLLEFFLYLKEEAVFI